MYKIGLLIFALCLASALSDENVDKVDRSADDLCTRYDNLPGYCIRVRNCTKVKRIFARRKAGTQTPDEEVYLGNSGCPVHKRGFVCCEDNELVSDVLSELSTHNCGEFGEMKTIGGTEIGLMSRPWMALLYFRSALDTENFTCGGTLINKRFVLTAAHCFNSQTLLSVRLGEHKISREIDCAQIRGREKCAPKAEDFDVDKVYIHEKYSTATGHNDIALIKLSKDVEFKESIRPICLPVTENLQRDANSVEQFHVAGWGKTETLAFSDVPTETIVRPKDHEKCQKSYRRQIISTQICAGERGKDSCNGDSGSPMTNVDIVNGQQRFVQHGIVSFGSSSCGDGHPGVYTKVGSFVRWIAYKIATK